MTRPATFRASIAREWRFLVRNPWDMALLTWLPLLLCGAIAWQFSGGVIRDLPVLLIDQDNSAIGRDLAIRIEAAPGLTLAGRVPDLGTAETIIRAKQAQAALLVPPDTARRALQGQAPVILYFNASYPAAAAAVQREAGAIVEAANARLAAERIAAIAAPDSVRPPPVHAVTSIAWNAPASQELQLVSLLHPALLHLLFMLAVVSAFGRELRDGSIGEWTPGIAALAGKSMPYLAVFMGWGLLATFWLAGVRGWHFVGSFSLFVTGYAAMYLAYLGVAVLLTGATRTLSQSLSITGLYAGASFAFAGAIFPLEQASAFARVWASALPYTHFARLLVRTWIAEGSTMAVAGPLLAMLGIALVTVVPGVILYLRAARDPGSWGRR
ncbi:MAG: ABC transporter permease [Sphingomonadales bacterium]|nr:ABC transporter permease [Sphingomonadales bacterium]NCQ22581.1 ABC transporter permease [Sphingomonadales bacterium]NCT04857.1 ABC transporter permease [Sphingomonadales bacterium]